MTRRLVAIAIGFALAAGAVQAAQAAADDHRYVGAKKCRTCHKKELIGDQYGKWKESRHAKAFETLKGTKALEAAKERGLTVPPYEAAECLKCHATAQGLTPEQMAKPLDPADGVQCESCHGPGNDYRKKKIMSDHDTAVAKGLWEPSKDEKICTTCHNDESPSWNPAKYQLADGSKVGFDFEQAKEEIQHLIPEDVKGRYVELEKKRRAERKARRQAAEDEEE